MILVDLITPCPQRLAVGSDFLLKLDDWAHIRLDIDGSGLDLLLENFKCFHELLVRHLTVVVSFSLHVFEVGQCLCSISLLLLNTCRRVPDRWLKIFYSLYRPRSFGYWYLVLTRLL